MCGDTEVWRDDLARWGQCGACQEAEELAPTFAQLSDRLAAILPGASRIVAWNSAFDYCTLQRTCALAQPTSERCACAMAMYAQWWGDYSDSHGDYRWQPLGGGHRAREDCLAV